MNKMNTYLKCILILSIISCFNFQWQDQTLPDFFQVQDDIYQDETIQSAPLPGFHHRSFGRWLQSLRTDHLWPIRARQVRTMVGVRLVEHLSGRVVAVLIYHLLLWVSCRRRPSDSRPWSSGSDPSSYRFGWYLAEWTDNGGRGVLPPRSVSLAAAFLRRAAANSIRNPAAPD